MNFNKIKELCEQQKITMPVLASKIGISEPGLYQIFRNKTLKVDILEKVARVLNVPIWVFFDLDPEKPLTEEIEKLKKENAGLIEQSEIRKNGIAYLNQKVDDYERIIELQKNMIHQQGINDETKERLIAEQAKIIKIAEGFLNLSKKEAQGKTNKKERKGD